MSEFDTTGGSTSARLRQVERERDEAVRRCADLEQVREELKQLRVRADGYAEDIQQLEGVRDQLVDEKRGLRAEMARVETERDEEAALAVRLRAFWNECSRDRDLIMAELASARKELDLLRAGRPADQQTEKSMTMNMTPEEHFARGLEFLALADNAPAMSAEDLAVAQTRAVVAHAHFGAAAAGTAMRAFAATDPAEKHEQPTAGVDDNLRAIWRQDGDPAAHRYVNDGAYCCTACGEHATARWHLIEAPDA